MRHSRFQQLHSGLNAAARKVYAAVPIAEPWTVPDIAREMARGGQRMDQVVLDGCIAGLISAGLVREPRPRMFVRTPVASPPARTEVTGTPPPIVIPYIEAERMIEKKTISLPVKAPAAVRTPIEILGPLAADLRALADRIDGAALELEQVIADRSAAAEKLKQLQSILTGALS